jgi:hypothetical protein
MPFVANLRDYADRIDQLEALNAIGINSDSNTVLLSIMGANGKLVREILSQPPKRDEIVNAKINEILALPNNQSKQIMLALVNSLLGGVTDDD